MPEKLYLAQLGCYEGRYVAGIYDSSERAMGVMPGKVWTLTCWCSFPDNDVTKLPTYRLEWANDLDWDDHCTVSEVEVCRDGPLRLVDVILRQTYDTRSRGWTYDTITTEEAARLAAESTSS